MGQRDFRIKYVTAYSKAEGKESRWWRERFRTGFISHRESGYIISVGHLEHYRDSDVVWWEQRFGLCMLLGGGGGEQFFKILVYALCLGTCGHIQELAPMIY